MATVAELKQAGFNDTEIAEYTATQTTSLSEAGFSQEEIATHQGVSLPGPKFPGGTPRDIRARVTEPEDKRPIDASLTGRAAKNFANRLILSDIEKARPSSGMVDSVAGMSKIMDNFQDLEDQGVITPDMGFWQGLKAFPKMWWAVTKGYYAPQSRKERSAAHDQLKKYRGATEFDIPTPETVGERVVDAATGLAAFVTRVAITKKILPASLNKYPNLQRAMSWELTNTEGLPGESAAMAGVMGSIGQIPAGTNLTKAGRLFLQSGALGGITAAKGGDKVDIAIASLIPFAFGALDAARGGISDAQMVRSWRQRLPFTRDIPMNTSVRYAKALRQMYRTKGQMEKVPGRNEKINIKEAALVRKNIIRNEKLSKQWEKQHGHAVDQFMTKANDAFKKVGGIGTQPFAEPIPQIPGTVTAPPKAPPVAKPPAERVITPKATKVVEGEVKEIEVFRGTTTTGGQAQENQSTFGAGIYYTNTKSLAQGYADTLSKIRGGNPVVQKNTITLQNPLYWADLKYNDPLKKLTGQELTNELLKRGFDGVVTSTKKGDVLAENSEIVVFAQPTPTAKPAEGEVPKKQMATQAQKAKVHIIAKEKGFFSEKGKLRPQYRRLAKITTGQTSIAKMTKTQASDFISAMNRLPEPRLVKGRLIPPSIPTTSVLAKRGQFQQKFGEPTPLALITDASYYATKLGVKSLVEPLEKAKQDFDFEYRNAALALEKQGVLIDKIGKTTTKERILSKVKNIPTKAREEIGRLLDKYEEAPPSLDPQKTKIFNYFRGLSRTMLARQNEARKKLGWPEIPSRKAYQRRIATDIAKEMLAGKYPFPEGVKFWSGINTGEKVFNPMEFQRRLEDDVFDLFIKDPVRASKAMMYTALKEIHLNQPLKFYKQQLNAIGKDMPEYKNLPPRERAELDKIVVIPASTRRWLTEYVNISILGRQSKLDETVNNIVTKTGLKGVFDKLLVPFGRTVGRKPITDFFRLAGRAQMAGVLGPRPKLIMRNKFQLTQNLALYTNKANIRAFGPNNAELDSLLKESRFLRDYTGLEDLPVDLAGKIEKLWHSAYQWSARSNAKQAMEVAYWDTKELIDNPIYKKHGWKNEHLLKEMEFGSSATQFHYTALGMPQIFRHKTLLPVTRLTSWWMNYFSKFHREAIHRAFTGRPSWAGSDGPTLPWSRRLGWLRYIILGGLILNTMGYTRSYLFGAAPTGWPPAMQFSWNAYLYTVSQDEKQKARAKKRMTQAAKTFIPGYIAVKDFEAVWTGKKDLSSLLFYKKVKK